MKISKALLLSIIKSASAEDAADDDKLAEHVRAHLDGKKRMIGRVQRLMDERAGLVTAIDEIDGRITNMQSNCTHELTEGSLCLTCGATV
jgi:hypothetical protein